LRPQQSYSDQIAQHITTNVDKFVEKQHGLERPGSRKRGVEWGVRGVDLTRKAQQNRTSLLTAVLKVATFLERVFESGSNQIELISAV